MQIKIYSLQGTVYEGETTEVTLPAQDGEITVLKGHIPLITLLKEGEIRTKEKNIPIKKGFAEITGEKVVVLVD
ncbi:MAG: hypothetical protein WCV55_00280 [Candidatus Paceibacterota bacterium]